MTDVVVVGSGSAGFRHTRELRRRLPDADIVVVRRANSSQPVDRLRELDVRLVDTVDAAASGAPRMAVIAGPATTHLRDASALSDVESMLVEKPLASDLQDALDLAALGTSRSAPRLLVGYHLRAGDLAPALRALLANGAIGEVDGFDLRVGQHLAQWRPGGDPAQSVSARATLGGGALRELSHEIDLLRFLLGDVASVSAQLRHDGAPTDGIVDTVADLKVRLSGGVEGTLHMDMVSDPPFRTWTVHGTDAALVADPLAGTIIRVDPNRRDERALVHTVEPGERDRAETRLIDNLIAMADHAERPLCNAEDGLATMRVVDAALRSTRSTTREPVDVTPTEVR